MHHELIFIFHQKFTFHKNFLLIQKSLTILAFTGEISFMWKLISLRTEMLHIII